ncbi:MAG TPA: Rieske 2Fe-2S domain-containing protein [Solirubrobacteraceae bacterium]|nr:Rieske 2Fe-2S domain-containing protein [Solirubrobacteraceae bacterium]
MKIWRWPIALLTLLFGKLARRPAKPPAEPPAVEQGTPERGAENVVLVLLGIASLFALGFIVAYAEFSPAKLPNALLGVCLGLCFLFIGVALTVVAKRLVVTEELEDDYPQEHPEAQREVAKIVHDSGSRITRKRLLLSAGVATGGALGAAALTPALSLGPLWDTSGLDSTPWRAGRRLVDENGSPLLAANVYERTFYTAFPEGADPENIGSPLVVLRVDPAKLDLPPGRSTWAPGGILAFSKICTHAGCAVALYRKPTFAPLEPQTALVCPCHYSTFDPFTGGTVAYGPAGRPLPQLPLEIDGTGYLRAAGNFSARVGPSWWNVRSKPTSD